MPRRSRRSGRSASRPAALGAKDLPPIDVLLLSHNHYDHLDLPTLAQLPLAPSATLVCPLKVSGYIDTGRFAKVTELDWHGATRIGGIDIACVPSIHFSARSLWDRNESLWGGYVLTTPNKRLYFSGDTAFGPVFDEIGPHYGPVDLALVPIGAYEPRKLMQASHCTPEEAVRIGRLFQAKQAIGMHWGRRSADRRAAVRAAGQVSSGGRGCRAGRRLGRTVRHRRDPADQLTAAGSSPARNARIAAATSSGNSSCGARAPGTLFVNVRPVAASASISAADLGGTPFGRSTRVGGRLLSNSAKNASRDACGSRPPVTKAVVEKRAFFCRGHRALLRHQLVGERGRIGIDVGAHHLAHDRLADVQPIEQVAQARQLDRLADAAQ